MRAFVNRNAYEAMLMKFKQYITEGEDRDLLLDRAINMLHYQMGYDMATLSKLPIRQLLADIDKLDILNAIGWPKDFDILRFAGMIKSKATYKVTREQEGQYAREQEAKAAQQAMAAQQPTATQVVQ